MHLLPVCYTLDSGSLCRILQRNIQNSTFARSRHHRQNRCLLKNNKQHSSIVLHCILGGVFIRRARIYSRTRAHAIAKQVTSTAGGPNTTYFNINLAVWDRQMQRAPRKFSSCFELEIFHHFFMTDFNGCRFYYSIPARICSRRTVMKSKSTA